MTRTSLLRPILAAALAGGVLAACAGSGSPSRQLVDARQAYAEAAASPAPSVASEELLGAHRALTDAELAHRGDPGSEAAQHLAYVATRRAQLATERAREAAARQQLAQARAEYANKVQGLEVTVRQKIELRDAEIARRNEELARRNQEMQQRTQQLTTRNQELEERARTEREARDAELARQAEVARMEREARAEAERERDAALQQLEEFAAVEETEAGTVITVGGDLLFRFDEAILMPTARAKLDQVAAALETVGSDQSLVIEGHADAIGPADYNRDLSRARAEAVRAYLVEQGVDPGKLATQGKGEREPIAPNDSAEGRANNRRVEIVISPPLAATR